MAWIKANPTSGSGDKSIALAVDQNKGRSTRTATVTFTITKTGEMTSGATEQTVVTQSGAALTTGAPRLFTGATSVTSAANVTNITSQPASTSFGVTAHKGQHYRVSIPNTNAYGAYILFSGSNGLTASNILKSVGFKTFTYYSGVESSTSVTTVESINPVNNAFNIGSSATDYGKYNMWGCEILLESNNYTNNRSNSQTGTISLVYRTTNASTTAKVDLFKVTFPAKTSAIITGGTGSVSVNAAGGQINSVIITAPSDATWTVSGATLDTNLDVNYDVPDGGGTGS